MGHKKDFLMAAAGCGGAAARGVQHAVATLVARAAEPGGGLSAAEARRVLGVCAWTGLRREPVFREEAQLTISLEQLEASGGAMGSSGHGRCCRPACCYRLDEGVVRAPHRGHCPHTHTHSRARAYLLELRSQRDSRFIALF